MGAVKECMGAVKECMGFPAHSVVQTGYTTLT